MLSGNQICVYVWWELSRSTLLATFKYTMLLSRFSHVRLCETPQTAAYQAPPSLGFSRQEYWSGLPFPSPMHESEKWKWSHSVMSDSSRPHGLQPTRLLHPWDFPRQHIKKQRHYFVNKGPSFKAMVFPVVMYGCENWTIKKAEQWRIDAFELWCWRRLLRVLWTARRSNQSIVKEICPDNSLEGLMM